MGRLERDYQATVKEKLKKEFPGCIIMKNDPRQIQGIPDLLILHKDRWAMLETKKERTSSKRTNQQYYVNKIDSMAFARFISPENEEEVFNELKIYFQ
jgi:hypothetical protein